MDKRLNPQNGIVCRMNDRQYGYFGWPSAARLDDGRLMVASSGLRTAHICPFGKTVINTSADNGMTWSAPEVIQDSLIDDRDAGIVNLGGGRVLVSWFRSDTRKYADMQMPEETRLLWNKALSGWTDEAVERLLGSWVMLSGDSGGSWGGPVRVPVSAPHGPVLLGDRSLLYLGKDMQKDSTALVLAARSGDGGRSWETTGSVPLCTGTFPENYHEPHAVELPSGRLIGMIRIQNHSGTRIENPDIPEFSMMQTESDDGGKTWTAARPLGFHGSPPHLLAHGSGTLILTYGYRKPPYGQRVAFSRDYGRTWDHDWILRDDGPDGDLGYPATVELGDKSLFTVYYQKASPGELCSLLWSRWNLPD